MLVYFNPADGSILYTLKGDFETPPSGDHIEVPDQELHGLPDWKVIDGELVQTSADTIIKAYRARVDIERDKVIAAGCDVQVAGVGTVALQGRPEDQRTITGLMTNAIAALMAQAPFSIPFRDRNNVVHVLNAQQVISMATQGSMFTSAIYQRSWAIKDMDPILTDPADPALWVLT